MPLALRCSLRRSHDSSAWRYLFRKTLVVIPPSILSCKGFELPGPLSCPKVLSLSNQFKILNQPFEFPCSKWSAAKQSSFRRDIQSLGGFWAERRRDKSATVISLSAMGTKWDSSGFVGFYHLANSDFCSKKIMNIPPHPQTLIFVQVSACMLLVEYLETKACAKGLPLWYLMAAHKGHPPVWPHSWGFIRFSSAVLTWLIMPWLLLSRCHRAGDAESTLQITGYADVAEDH